MDGHENGTSPTLAKPLAPEDVAVDDFVTPLYTITQWPSFLWCVDAATVPPHEPIRIQVAPHSPGIPLKVKQICLPFILVKHPIDGLGTLDVRQCRLARLERRYARRSWKAYRKHRSRRKRGNRSWH